MREEKKAEGQAQLLAFKQDWAELKKKEGTQRMGTLKGASSTTCDDDGVDRSEVIRRHLSAGAGTPLYT